MAIEWTDELIDTICDRIIAGESVHQICKSQGMPSEPSFYRKMMADPEFERTITRAREVAQEPETEKLKDIADGATPETVNVAKLQIWTRMWIASKKAPKKYGDKVHQEITGADGSPLVSGATVLSPEQIEQVERIRERREQAARIMA